MNHSKSEVFLAIDLGASSGRLIGGRLDDSRLFTEELARFTNRGITVAGTSYWDVLAIYAGILDGLTGALASGYEPISLAIDAWGLDYGLFDANRRLLGNPVHYRDERTAEVFKNIDRRMAITDLYDRTGIQMRPFTTLFQLLADKEAVEKASLLLMIPDLLVFWLTGTVGSELTVSSTTGFLSLGGASWNVELMGQLDIPAHIFPEVVSPGTWRGSLTPSVADAVGSSRQLGVVSVASHDTASALVAIPTDRADFAFISCGTWSLVGVELEKPVVTESGRRLDFTNEAGLDGTIRFLRNITGLWLLQESMRMWLQGGEDVSLPGLLEEAATIPGLRTVIDTEDPRLSLPGDMPGRIAALVLESGQGELRTKSEIVRCVMDSLALAHRKAIRQAVDLTQMSISAIHIVGGGSANELLCQLTADACQMPVIAGPVEAAAVGNLLVQARVTGELSGDLKALRLCSRRSSALRRYLPSEGEATWARAERQVADSFPAT